jgi:phosphatidate cytidylyltransferase
LLRWRLLSASIIISILVGLLYLDFQLGKESSLGMPGLVLVPIGLVIAMLAVGELLSMLRCTDLQPLGWTSYVGTAAVMMGACVPVLWKDYPETCAVGRLGWPTLGLALGIGLAFVGEMRRYEKSGKVIVQVALAVFPMVYIGVLLGFVAQLRTVESNAWGLFAFLSMVIVVKVSDSGAYAVGRLFGRHKLAPKLSPGKTIEGALGGLAFGCTASWLLFTFLAPILVVGHSGPAATWWASIIFGAIITITGIIGDLAESLIKRDADRKDSSSWLPGLGGVLDILDSILAAAPAAYACWLVGLVGPQSL